VIKKLVDLFHSLRKKLLDLQDAPHALAGGVAIGMFIGFTPLFGVKTLLCLGIAFLLRCNPIAAVVSLTIHDVVLPLWPVLLGLEYEIGSTILRFVNGTPPAIQALNFQMHDVMQWTTFFGLGLPMLIGSMFLSAPAAAIAYFATLPIFQRREALRKT
jgi:uncharacterized protein (DUF2062 family)